MIPLTTRARPTRPATAARHALRGALSGLLTPASLTEDLVLAVIAVVCVLSAKACPPAGLFTAQTEYDELARAHASSPCVYASADYFAPLTQDLLQLRQFRNFLVVDEETIGDAKEYIGDADEAVLYIDVSKTWSSGYDPDRILRLFGEATGLTSAEVLYTYDYEYDGGLSVTYLMQRP